MSDKSMEQTILETAERLFIDRGFSLTSTTDIAKEVGCNQSLINYYFRSKEKLFQTIFKKKALVFLASLREPLEAHIPLQEKIRVMSERHFMTLSENAKLPFFILNEIHTNPERLNVVKTIITDILQQISPSLNEELALEIQEGRMRNTTLFEIFLTMASLNIGVFLFHPVLKNFINKPNDELRTLLLQRSQENTRILLLSLEP